jgi:hypothetical protein
LRLESIKNLIIKRKFFFKKKYLFGQKKLKFFRKRGASPLLISPFKKGRGQRRTVGTLLIKK